MQIPVDYLKRVYAGWYGKIIGVRHGSNVEGWTYEKIAETYGEIDGYLFDFKNFAADDDTNGPIFFIRGLEDYACSENITPKNMGETVLNYVPLDHSFFWLGGYGVSTEHTALLNLLHGIDAPLSGSVELNGAAVAEQIGGQIFIETWGLVNPCDYRRAARYAAKMASVTHGGNGIYGGMFVAACVSAAFAEKNVQNIIEAGLSVIPPDCEYARMVQAVRDFYAAHPEDWRQCFAYVQENFGYHLYPGACHIIPNAAVVLLSLLYGNGDFSRSINICNMCGWDTDCNVANVGCILGVAVGLEGIHWSWREPINDFLACSSVLGCMNLRDVANDALYLASLGYRLAGEPYPEALRPFLEGSAPRFSFVLPESTHSFRTADCVSTYENISDSTALGGRCLRARVQASPTPRRLYRQTYYQPQDFSDDRYSPAFTPEVFPGQQVVFRVKPQSPITLRAYAYDLYSQSCIYGESVRAAGWTTLTLDLPSSDGCIGQVGLELPAGEAAVVDLDSLDYQGGPDYVLDFSKAGLERWTAFHTELSQTSTSQGIWSIENGAAVGSCADHGELFTGGRDFADYSVTVDIQPMLGRTHLVLIRAQGNLRSYMAGFQGQRLVIIKNQREPKVLASMEYPWENGRPYRLTVEAKGNRISLAVDGQSCLWTEDQDQPYLTGCYGFSVQKGSRCKIERFTVQSR
ncbi:MAG: ADP-ribosylglycohydrolase family protein [Acutalibacter sp.]|nr:ADP-ribosylglycohydrolase family protein [Acutalibacter sp.]